MRSPDRVNAGDFRDVIAIYQDLSDDTDEQQSFTGNPVYSSIPAKVEHVGGHERDQDTFIKYEVTFHYLDNVTAAMEVKVLQGPFKDEVLNIGEVELLRWHGRPRYTRLHCTKVA